MNDNPYSPPQAQVADFSSAPQREEFEGFHDLTGLVRWLTIALASLAFIELVQIVSLWLEIGLLTQAQSGGGITREAALANDRREDLLSIISLLAYFLTAVLFLRWTYLVKKNAMALGASFLEFEFSPGWSVGYYFVPFVNLVAPYKALKETFQASHPEFRPDSQRLEWSSAPKLLPFWWALWLVNGFLGRGFFSTLFMPRHSPSYSICLGRTSPAQFWTCRSSQWFGCWSPRCNAGKPPEFPTVRWRSPSWRLGERPRR